MPEVAVHLFLLDFNIGNRALEVGIPVHQPLIAVDQLFLVQLDEHLAHGIGQPLIEGEPLATPVAGGTQAPKLIGDGAATLRLPLPDLGHKVVAAHVAAALIAGLRQLAFHHHLGGDAGVVCAGQPQHRLAPHPLKARQYVLQGVVQRVADVQGSRHIRRRDDDGERLSIRVRDRRKGTRGLPLLVEARLGGFRIEGFF